MEVEDGNDDSDDEDWERVAVAAPPEILGAQPAIGTHVGEWFVERSKCIPLRLTLIERKYLRLLEAALSVSEYTDKIDTLSFGQSKAKRIVHQIRELCAIMSGLMLSADYKKGQELFQDRDFQENAEFYQQIFELGRRHKIMNPDKMRSTYGKLIYLLQVCFSVRYCTHSKDIIGQSKSRGQRSLELFMRTTNQDCLCHPRRRERPRPPPRRPRHRRHKRNLLRRPPSPRRTKGHQRQRACHRDPCQTV